ncbi:MAG TPA: hypothetical protein VGB70_06560 [Allosphingosinicella sp.]|jgi:ABC-type branched-subunit amino acid transport system permease subunit
MAEESAGFVAIAHVYSQPEADVLVATLQAYGFTVLAGSRGMISVMPDMMVALGGIPIAVASAEAEDAVALMAEIDSGWQQPPAPFDGDPALNGAVSIGSTLLGGVPMPRVEGDYAWRRRS